MARSPRERVPRAAIGSSWSTWPNNFLAAGVSLTTCRTKRLAMTANLLRWRRLRGRTTRTERPSEDREKKGSRGNSLDTRTSAVVRGNDVARKGDRRHPQTSELVGTDRDAVRFLADRGYEEQKFFFDVDQAGGAFIVRGTKKIRPTLRAAFDSAGKPIPRLLCQTLNWDRLPAHTVDLDIEWQAKSFVYRGRIVAIYKRGQRNAKTFVYLHTNLARNGFSAADVAGLYRLRWQVELLFKEFKSHANLHAFDTGKAAIAKAMIWASLLAALLKRSLAHFAEASLGVELSTRRAAASGKHYFDDVLRGLLDSPRQLRRALAEALKFLDSNARRAHPARDRKRGRLAMGLEPLALAP
jgi:IS4 transposase